uniref:Uncharacterized protein n=1 Tax=Plectus sambesii TaxID=2011161 RepID=A0A914WZ84_9BILA
MKRAALSGPPTRRVGVPHPSVARFATIDWSLYLDHSPANVPINDAKRVRSLRSRNSGPLQLMACDLNFAKKMAEGKSARKTPRSANGEEKERFYENGGRAPAIQ